MTTLTDVIVNFGDIFTLNFTKYDCAKFNDILTKHKGWKYYQPHKPGYNRYGLSVTSLDGGYSGEPDLMSLREYYQRTGKSYTEIDFKKRTSIVEFLPELNELLDFFEPGLGRTHFIRLDKGGFFPPHRDNGAVPNVESFRILVPINNFGVNDCKFILDEKIVNLQTGYFYFINTSKIHSIFSFVDNCSMLVLNVNHTTSILEKMVRKLEVV